MSEDTNTNRMVSLNPCFNGRYSQSLINIKMSDKANSLNPCFNGRYSQRFDEEWCKGSEELS